MSIEEWLITIFLFFIGFFIASILHELFHYWSAKRQGCNPTIEVWYWHGIPSLMCCPNGIVNESFYLAGGAGAGLVYLILGYICVLVGAYSPLSIALATNAFAQILYGMYEFLFHDIPTDIYMKYHYLVYIIGVIVGLILVYPLWI